jgi:hypothetical protein
LLNSSVKGIHVDMNDFSIMHGLNLTMMGKKKKDSFAVLFPN